MAIKTKIILTGTSIFLFGIFIGTNLKSIEYEMVKIEVPINVLEEAKKCGTDTLIITTFPLSKLNPQDKTVETTDFFFSCKYLDKDQINKLIEINWKLRDLGTVNYEFKIESE